MTDLDDEMLATVAEAQSQRWDTMTELLAALVELVDIGNRMFYRANFKGRVPDPVEINRPGSNGAEPEEHRPATAAEMRAFFGGAVEYTP